MAGLLIAGLFLPRIASPAENKSGKKLTLLLKDGKAVEGELLTIMGDRLILFDTNTSIGTDTRIGEVAQIRVCDKPKAAKGFGRGLVIGAASGAVLGLLSGNDHWDFSSFQPGKKPAWGPQYLGSSAL